MCNEVEEGEVGVHVGGGSRPEKDGGKVEASCDDVDERHDVVINDAGYILCFEHVRHVVMKRGLAVGVHGGHDIEQIVEGGVEAFQVVRERQEMEVWIVGGVGRVKACVGEGD